MSETNNSFYLLLPEEISNSIKDLTIEVLLNDMVLVVLNLKEHPQALQNNKLHFYEITTGFTGNILPVPIGSFWTIINKENNQKLWTYHNLDVNNSFEGFINCKKYDGNNIILNCSAGFIGANK